MADSQRKSLGRDAVAEGAARNPPHKRTPPKLRQKLPSEAKPESSKNAQDDRPPQDEAYLEADEGYLEADEGVPSNEPPSNAEDAREYSPETQSTEEADLPAPEPQETRRLRPRRTIELDRERDAPPEVWRRGNQQASEQQLVQLDDVGNTLDQAEGLVRDVGTKAVGTVGRTAGQAVGALGTQSGEENKGKEEQLRLRLDLNLDIEVQLKAKIHGDLTLQLL
ncbi:hypothetical protein BDW59DRAFT_166912 [Aspergillus cavernicola]|uniref:Uncharacterized protein n=1 Tax=Aspergillus cavernicola TaxID=176166 RepID=A0ABR4HHV2_9EURO